MKFKKNEVDYIIWQNRATGFYLASRLLAFKEIWAPSAFCAQQTLEALLKATLIYWDKSFDPIKARHNFKKMIRIMRNKVPNSKGIIIPEYFYADDRYQQISRYPKAEKGVLIPANFLNDLDNIFYNLIVLVPFQFNSVLWNIIKRKEPQLFVLRRKNSMILKLRKFLLK